jgi:mRNA-degrading endonuclease RelE of RelBE toxin-antitoxin system
MPTTVNISADAQRDVKHLKRKYPAVTGQVRKLIDQLENDERPGDRIPAVGFDVYKVRLPNPSAQRGKSGGFRMIYYVQMTDNVYLLKVYSKTEQADISAEEIRRIAEAVLPPDDSGREQDS